MCGVKGVVLDASILLKAGDDENGSPSLRADAVYVLRKLRYSNIFTGISYGLDLSAPKVRLLQESARLYSYNCFVFRPSAIDNFVSEVSLEWGDNTGSYMHVVSSYKDEEIAQMISSGWLITVLRSPGKASDVEYSTGTENPSKIFINKLEELPLIICHLNKKWFVEGFHQASFTSLPLHFQASWSPCDVLLVE
uniref:Inositol-tetrakisphosphate 1-kinase n=1 Tax=Solanum tuberosum TaxID=4113 RepID=M1CD41_SOLTU